VVFGVKGWPTGGGGQQRGAPPYIIIFFEVEISYLLSPTPSSIAGEGSIFSRVSRPYGNYPCALTWTVHCCWNAGIPPTIRHSILSVFNMAASSAVERPKCVFTYHSSASSFAVPVQTYLAEHSDPRYSYIAIGALVFDKFESTKSRVLLLQRSADDSMPNLWEVPGGGCDDIDESILHAVARELWEEARLKATFIGQPVGSPHFFNSRSGKKICKFTFMVETENVAEGRLEVRIDPQEHQQFLWASEDEVRSKRAGLVELVFTTQQQEDTVLAGFAHLAKDGAEL
jgi:8-oxo-dGTP pyrophosphatase MutT (NUDIX family)